MKRNENATCGNCPYWDEEKKDGRYGYCRRHSIQPGDEVPTSGPKNWCGEHPDFWQTDLSKIVGAVPEDEQSTDAPIALLSNNQEGDG
jgi:hypothetical protein